MYSPEKAILEALVESGGCWTGFQRTGHYVRDASFMRLYEQGYISGMGSDWNTAIFCITPKGHEYLKELTDNDCTD